MTANKKFGFILIILGILGIILMQSLFVKYFFFSDHYVFKSVALCGISYLDFDKITFFFLISVCSLVELLLGCVFIYGGE